jgi:hypothetical protein
MPRIRLPRHVTRLVTRLVAPLVVNYFAYAALPSASARRAARHAAHRAAPRRLLRPHRFASRRLVVNYFTHTARPGASARRAARRRPRTVSPLDFSSVGRTGSCRVPDCSVSRFDYYVHRHSTCCPVALALLQPRCASRLLVSR